MAVNLPGLVVPLTINPAGMNAAIPQINNQLQAFTNQVSRKTSFAVQNLSFQINDVVSGLAMGQAPMRIFTQQAGQFVQLFQQGGGVKAVLGGVAQTMRGLITPTTLVVGGLAAVAAGAGYLVHRNLDVSRSTREFDVILRGLGVTSQATGRDLENQAKRLRDVGISAADAREEITAITRAGLNPARAESIIRTGRDVGAVLGGDGVQTITAALSGGLEPTIKLGIALRALTAEEIAQYREMARMGDAAKATGLAFDRITEKVKGLADDALTPTARAMRDLANAWKDVLDWLSKTTPIETLAKIVSGLSQGVSNMAAGGRFGDAAYAPIPQAVTASGKSVSGSAAAAAADAESMVGLNKRTNRDQIASYLASGGVKNLSPADVAWCAAFANAALARQGISGTGSNVATSFLNWGSAVNGDPAAGDVIVIPRGHAAGSPGGHVGLATGQTQLGSGGMQYEMVSGNEKDSIAKTWVNASESVLRRAAGVSGSGDGGPVLPNDIGKSSEADKRIAAIARQAEAYGKLGLEREDATAAIRAGDIAEQEEVSTADKARIAQALRTDALKQAGGQIKIMVDATDQESSGLRRVSDALAESTAAGTKMEAQLRAEAEAVQLFGRANSKAANEFINTRSGQLVQLDQYRSIANITRQTNELKNQTDLVRLEASLSGESAENVSRQVDLLRAKQQILDSNLSLEDKEAVALVEQVNALHDAADKLAENRRIMDTLRDVADTLKGSFENIFDTIVDGTFKFKNAIGTLLKDLGKLLADKGFKALVEGQSGGGTGTGLLGSVGKLFGIGGGAGSTSDGGQIDFGGGGDLPAFATGGSFRVGGAGAIDSKVVAFRATPGEMVDVSKPGMGGSGGGEVIRLELTHSDAFVGEIADQRIRTHSGTIIDVAVRKSQQTTRRAFTDLAAEAQARRA